ncbi:hypothetical protein LTR70_010446 [Exophiala xenobiotica]|uniref:Uncharacterized protein n=1 Tax=Lithohypha guttulata TaxID=1690604 RepID=A0ABR0JUA8_9EURO|nr:hypothetical protein LTR24_010431 [Lithohypha guttulata]KAK5309269.1 hypothetical protein LTR70_010446 [Exophiala xenobiotica]
MFYKGHKRSFSTAHGREDNPPPVRSRTPLPPQSEVVPDFVRSSNPVRKEKSYERNQERARSHWNANFDATLSGRSLKADTDRAANQPPSPALDSVRSSTSPHAHEDGVLATPAGYVTGPTYFELAFDLDDERTNREALESELHATKEEVTALRAENEALRRETQLMRKEKEAMGRSYGTGASIADVRGGRSRDARAAVKDTPREPDAASRVHASKDIVRSNSPKSKRLRRLEEMVDYKDIEIAFIKDHNKRTEEWNKEQLQKVRDLQDSVNQESEIRRKAEDDLKKVEQETNEILKDILVRPKRFSKGSRA